MVRGGSCPPGCCAPPHGQLSRSSRCRGANRSADRRNDDGPGAPTRRGEGLRARAESRRDGDETNKLLERDKSVAHREGRDGRGVVGLIPCRASATRPVRVSVTTVVVHPPRASPAPYYLERLAGGMAIRLHLERVTGPPLQGADVRRRRSLWVGCGSCRRSGRQSVGEMLASSGFIDLDIDPHRGMVSAWMRHTKAAPSDLDVSPSRHVFGLTDWFRNGSLAEYTAVEARNLAPLPVVIGTGRPQTETQPSNRGWAPSWTCRPTSLRTPARSTWCST